MARRSACNAPASLAAIRAPGELRAFYQRIRARAGHPIVIGATARKMAKLSCIS